MDTDNRKLITIDEAIEYVQAMMFQYENSSKTELTSKYIEDTIRDYANWEDKDVIKLFAKKFKNKKRKNSK